MPTLSRSFASVEFIFIETGATDHKISAAAQGTAKINRSAISNFARTTASH